jgi:hypothetical protein
MMETANHNSDDSKNINYCCNNRLFMPVNYITGFIYQHILSRVLESCFITELKNALARYVHSIKKTFEKFRCFNYTWQISLFLQLFVGLSAASRAICAIWKQLWNRSSTSVGFCVNVRQHTCAQLLALFAKRYKNKGHIPSCSSCLTHPRNIDLQRWFLLVYSNFFLFMPLHPGVQK